MDIAHIKKFDLNTLLFDHKKHVLNHLKINRYHHDSKVKTTDTLMSVVLLLNIYKLLDFARIVYS